MYKFKVTGMSCAACSSRVEKAVIKVPGVQSVAVSLLTNSMGVEYEPDKRRSEERRVGKECRSRWSPYH